MAARVRLFLRLLKAELEDLAEDLQFLEQNCAKRFRGEEITPYVFKENDALLRRELDSILNLAKIVDGIEPSLYKNSDELQAALLARAKDLVQHYQEPEAVLVFLKRKLDKIQAYIVSGEDSPARP